MNINPIQDKIAVKVKETQKKTPGGIELIQPIDGDAPIQGTVVAVGPGKYNEAGIREALEISVGDVVAFPQNAGVKLTDYGVTVLLEAEVIAVIG